jgi:hypothetical protein
MPKIKNVTIEIKIQNFPIVVLHQSTGGIKRHEKNKIANRFDGCGRTVIFANRACRELW